MFRWTKEGNVEAISEQFGTNRAGDGFENDEVLPPMAQLATAKNCDSGNCRCIYFIYTTL